MPNLGCLLRVAAEGSTYEANLRVAWRVLPSSGLLSWPRWPLLLTSSSRWCCRLPKPPYRGRVIPGVFSQAS